MNRSFTKWKELGLRSFFALILIGAVAGLSACGNGGGDGAGSPGNTGNGFGVLTISGNDTATLGNIYSPTSVPVDTAGELTWTSPPPGGALNKVLTAVGTGDRIDLSIEFLTASQPLGAMEKVTLTYVKGQDKKVYLCDVRANAVDTPCKGSVIQDKAAKTVTFTNLEIAIDTDPRIQSNTATGPIILNGTLSTKASVAISGTGTSEGGANTNNAGSVTASGNDIGGVLTPSGFGQSEGPNSVTRSWLSSTMTLTINFNLDGTIINSILVFAGNLDLKYMCGGFEVSCTGITHDFSAKSVTFNGTVFGPFSNAATAPVTVNGTLKYMDSGTEPSGGTPTDGTGTGGGTPNDGTPTGGTGKASSLVSDAANTCALLTSGSIKCWGSNAFGELGNGSSISLASYASSPVLVNGITTATKIGAGFGIRCALLSSGQIKCWGINSLGQLGNGLNLESSVPVLVNGINTATDLAIGDHHSCAILAGGSVKCWGGNSVGQLGNETTKVLGSEPVLVSGITTAIKVAIGKNHTCAILVGGTVKCWGSNAGGQLGNGTTESSSTPVLVSLITGASDIKLAVNRSCVLTVTIGSAVDSDFGVVHCWGTTSTATFVRPGAKIPSPVFTSNVTAFEVKNDYLCTIGNGATVDCIGRGSQSGIIQGLSSTTKVVIGKDHACALLSDGTIRCWGGNLNGELGDGTTVPSTAPTFVNGITTATNIYSDFMHTCALLSSGKVKCWGDNFVGKLGNGTTIDSSTPVDVVGL